MTLFVFLISCFHFLRRCGLPSFFFFFFNDTATTEIYTLSLHDALPISSAWRCPFPCCALWRRSLRQLCTTAWSCSDRKSTRLNSSHDQISYAVFCLKKKKKYKLSLLLK